MISVDFEIQKRMELVHQIRVSPSAVVLQELPAMLYLRSCSLQLKFDANLSTMLITHKAVFDPLNQFINSFEFVFIHFCIFESKNNLLANYHDSFMVI